MTDGLFCMLLWHSNMLNKGINLGAKGGGSLIEGDADEAILQVLDIAGQGDAVSHTVVDISAIRREGGEGLKPGAVTQQRAAEHRMCLEVSHIDIRLRIEHFEPLTGQTVEAWDDQIGGEGDITP